MHTADATSTQSGGQRITVAHPPLHDVEAVRITTRKTVSVVHGSYSGAADTLPDTSIVSIVECRQGDTVYTAGTDYKKNGDTVDWSPTGNEPATGSTYSCTYECVVSAEPKGLDADGFRIEGAVNGSSILITYRQALPRLDRLAINQEGLFVWLQGVASESTPRNPSVPASLLPIATVGQTWRSTRTVLSDGVRVVPFSEIETINRRIDAVQQEVARQRLEADVFTRESGARAGIFVDPLLNDDMRDQGLSQTAAVVGGVLTLPIEATATALPNDVAAPTANPWTPSPLLAQPLRTGSMKVNPYMAFDPLPGRAVLNPALDRWTETQTDWTSAVTQRFDVSRDGYFHIVVDRQTSTTTETVGSATSQLEYLREIDVAYHIEGFGAGEQLASATFDGIALAVSGTADGNGTLDGSFHIPAKVPSGAKAVTFTGKGGSRASAVFVGQGQLTVNTLRQVNTITTIWVDPLAQTFVLDKATQLAGVDLWFTAKGGDVRLQIRDVANGVPSRTVLAEAHIPASSIVVSGGGHTRVLLPSPLSLAAGTEYAFVVLCDDAETALSVAELGKFDATAQQWVVSQPYQVGVLLSSSNASTWTAHQDRDLTFRLLEGVLQRRVEPAGTRLGIRLRGHRPAAPLPLRNPERRHPRRVRHGPARRGNPDRGRRPTPAPRRARDRADQRQGPARGDVDGQPGVVARHAAHQRGRGPDRRLRHAIHPRPRRDQGRARLRRRHPLRGNRHPADPQGLRRVGGAHGGRHHQSGRRACGVPLQGGALQRQRGQGQSDPDRHGHGPPPRQQHPAHGRDLGAAMIDEKTTYLKLPLPHPDNLLEDDVLRLRETLQGLDANAKTQDDALKAQSDGLQGVEEELQQQKQDLRDLLAAAVVSAFSPAGSRISAIVKGTNYTVPAYTVGNKRLRVYLCGLRCEAGADVAVHQYQEVGTAGAASTVIRWHDAIPTDYDILAEVI